jgi:hypothetical protein
MRRDTRAEIHGPLATPCNPSGGEKVAWMSIVAPGPGGLGLQSNSTILRVETSAQVLLLKEFRRKGNT